MPVKVRLASPFNASPLEKVAIRLFAPLATALTAPLPASSQPTPLPVEVSTCPSEPCAPATVKLFNSTVPFTSNACVGVRVPIPTLPLPNIDNCSSATASPAVVPTKKPNLLLASVP